MQVLPGITGIARRCRYCQALQVLTSVTGIASVGCIDKRNGHCQLLLALDKAVGDGAGLEGRGVIVDVEFGLEGGSSGGIEQIGVHGGGSPLSGFGLGDFPRSVDGDLHHHGSLFAPGVAGFGRGGGGTACEAVTDATS